MVGDFDEAEEFAPESEAEQPPLLWFGAFESYRWVQHWRQERALVNEPPEMSVDDAVESKYQQMLVDLMPKTQSAEGRAEVLIQLIQMRVESTPYPSCLEEIRATDCPRERQWQSTESVYRDLRFQLLYEMGWKEPPRQSRLERVKAWFRRRFN